jgi:hypothetical protein
MSTLWTPSGEHPVGRERPGQPAGPEGAPPGAPPAGGGAPGDPGDRGGPPGDRPDAPSPEDAEHLDELRRQLASAPAEVVVANHCFGLFELAGVYLSQSPPRLEQARLAIDAFGAVVEGVGGRLGEVEGTLRDALAQIRLAFVQISGAQQAATGAGDADGVTPPGGSAGPGVGGS